MVPKYRDDRDTREQLFQLCEDCAGDIEYILHTRGGPVWCTVPCPEYEVRVWLDILHSMQGRECQH